MTYQEFQVFIDEYTRINQEQNMGTLSDHHKQLSEFGEGKCSAPMWCNGMPAGFCDQPAYGEYIPGEEYRNGWTGEWRRFDGKYNGYVPALACPHHGGPQVRTFMDGNAWCAVHPDFIDLQASPAGFGDTREEAIKALPRS